MTSLVPFSSPVTRPGPRRGGETKKPNGNGDPFRSFTNVRNIGQSDTPKSVEPAGYQQMLTNAQWDAVRPRTPAELAPRSRPHPGFEWVEAPPPGRLGDGFWMALAVILSATATALLICIQIILNG